MNTTLLTVAGYEREEVEACWLELERAMWALQGLSDKDLVDNLVEAGVGYWVQLLANAQRRKQKLPALPLL